MRRRRPELFPTLFHIVLVISTTATTSCASRDNENSKNQGGTQSPATFRVALLHPGPISDHSWNAGAYEGLLRIRDSLLTVQHNYSASNEPQRGRVIVSHIQTQTPAQFEENFREYGRQGYNLVFGHGFEFQDAAERVAPEFPKTVYITTSGNRVARNVAPMVFGFEDASYLAGMIAGALTKSNVVGTIGGTELPPVRSSFIAFTAGARATNPAVRVLSSYIGSWDDVSAAKEQALAQINQGADFIFQNADAAGLGIFRAARESKQVYVFGANSDQNDVAPDVVIASVVIDLPHAFLAVAREVKEGRFRPRVISLGASSDVVKLVLNPRLEHLIPQSVRTAVDSVQRHLTDGTFKPPRLEFVDTAGAH